MFNVSEATSTFVAQRRRDGRGDIAGSVETSNISGTAPATVVALFKDRLERIGVGEFSVTVLLVVTSAAVAARASLCLGLRSTDCGGFVVASVGEGFDNRLRGSGMDSVAVFIVYRAFKAS